MRRSGKTYRDQHKYRRKVAGTVRGAIDHLKRNERRAAEPFRKKLKSKSRRRQ